MRFLILALAVALAAGCGSPTAPTDPPLKIVSENTTDHIHVSPMCFLAQGGNGVYTWTANDNNAGGHLDPSIGTRACYWDPPNGLQGVTIVLKSGNQVASYKVVVAVVGT